MYVHTPYRRETQLIKSGWGWWVGLGGEHEQPYFHSQKVELEKMAWGYISPFPLFPFFLHSLTSWSDHMWALADTI